ncbi:hypothetical protein [Candidatus Lokiarchaeum ossiferum]|uniref:hypothetical protein n=1 Tax=Candidatus Lokiarchaeum ossiferum TaxID=2951803 RepID=UPI00352D9832
MEINFIEEDKNAAWDLYVELLTRITTQPLNDNDGIEITALESIYSIFSTTRKILKKHGRKCIQFSKIAIIVLNQVIRPFTAKWHLLSKQGTLNDNNGKLQFRNELKQLQSKLSNYSKLLAEIANVEDLTIIDENQKNN